MGCGASASKDAPHLAEYFKKLMEKTKHTQEEAANAGMEMLMGGGTKMKEMKQEMVDWYEKEGKPVLEKSFKHHDKDDSKALEREEAKVFFLNLIQETETFTAALAQTTAKMQLQTTTKMMAGMIGKKEAKAMEKQMKEQLDAHLKAQAADLKKRIEAYKKNKEELDAAAFKVMDTREDGKIQLDEFLATLDPNGSKQPELLVALGFMTEQEKVQADAMKQMGEGMAEGDGGCPQQ